MDRIKRSWQLAKASFEVLTKDKELLIFPILSSIAMMLVAVSFLVPTLVSSVLDGIFDSGLSIFGYVVIFLFYLVQSIVVTFFNTALVGAALIRLRGGDPTVKDGLQGNIFIKGSFYKTQDNNLIYGGHNGFNKFDPLKIKQDTFIPPVKISDFRILNTSVDYDFNSNKEIEISHKQRSYLKLRLINIELVKTSP